MILYYRPTCPYCRKVLTAAAELGISFDLRDINDEESRQALIARGGKQQVPYFVDEAHGVEMYESDDIVQYLRAQHPTYA